MNYLEGRVSSSLERQRSRTTFSHVATTEEKSGYLWKTFHHPRRTSSKTRYFVLTKSSLDHFRNHHREKLKGSLPLAAIDSVEKLPEDKSASNELHHEFPMIKYARGGRSIPHERVFKLDNDNLHSLVSCKLILLCLQMREIIYSKDHRVNRHKFDGVDPVVLWLKRHWSVMSSRHGKGISVDQAMSFAHRCCNGAKRKLLRNYVKDVLEAQCGMVQHNENLLWNSFLMLFNALNEQPRVRRYQYSVFRGFPFKCYWTLLILTWLFQIPCCFELETISFGFASQSFTIDSFKLFFIIPLRGLNVVMEKITCLAFVSALNKYVTCQESYVFNLTSIEQEYNTVCFFQESLSIPACARLMSIHDKFHMMYKQKCAGDDPESYRLSKSFLSYNGFLSYLRSKDNSPVNPEHSTVYQEMDHPLTDYFINSSHNTYLTGRQLKGKSSLEAYVRALLQGCRCVELDCWDGPDEPVITHGLTLTSKIRFRDVVQVIKEYAFEASEFPLILSLENHCNEQQQAIMADIFVTELGDMLATNNLSDELGIQTLPSPKDLKRKILLKGKIKVKKKHKISTSIWPGVTVNPIAGFSPRVKKTSKVLVSSQSEAVLARSESSHSLGPRVRSVTTTTLDDKGSTSEEPYNIVPLEDAMGKLIVYCRAVPYKKNEVSEDCCEMYSFNDGAAQDSISAHPRVILSLANKHIVRTYPKGSRVDSSNYNPQVMWNAGIQMVAINFQKPDSGMHLNQGKFRKNGGCGYILKPNSLRDREKSNYHPMIKESPKNGKSCYFTIEVLSGQYLHADEDSQLAIRVDVETVGVAEDCAVLSTEPTLDKLNPKFENAKHLFKIIMPELCLVYFKVHLLNRNKSRLLFQNVISLDSLRPGIHYIRLRSPTGVEVPHSGLFVRIKLQDFEPSCDKIKGTSRERLLTF
ncbi:1-phosphatidylinositol 4,5-bisphosphate phosphodiesterase zeta-1-like [Orbicella faveolata]|uniref:1-phosphatidylinositol 4,5-bisphosphate phosphodiesterase zeta-1-like n=1 Tax=Orbicella faveolata TaxID=48498 RepID=UPI0009E4C2B2|nr:1-phosphatidylinositol 4,5-bisphosphate phosphodiesterase zeta-1-like [Orbicella faveolata]